MDLTVRGLPFGTRVRRFVSRAILWLSRSAPFAGASRSTLSHSRRAAAPRHYWRFTVTGQPGPPGSPPPTGFLPGAGPCHVRRWIQTSRHDSGASIMTQPATTGISPIAVNTSFVIPVPLAWSRPDPRKSKWRGACWGGRPPTASLCQNEVVGRSQTREPSVSQVMRIGMDTSMSVLSSDPKTRDTPRDPVASQTAALFGTRVAETILAAVMCDRDNRPDI